MRRDGKSARGPVVGGLARHCVASMLLIGGRQFWTRQGYFGRVNISVSLNTLYRFSVGTGHTAVSYEAFFFVAFWADGAV